MSAYQANDFEYHLNRVLSKFTMVISAEKAEILAALLGSDENDPGKAA